MDSLVIKSGQGDYRVDFLELDAAIQAVFEIPNAVFLIDRKVAELYKGPLGSILSSGKALLIDATEEEKSLAGVGKVATWFQELRCNRHSVLVAIGGGITQDIACFSAHIFHRGMKWVFVPTTLLSMSDSCIGAKCGINHNDAKNQLGFFYSPSRVLVATEFVNTLSDVDVMSGYGEILKLMITGSEDLLQKLEEVVAREGLRNGRLAELIRGSLVVKKGIIEEDEYEADLRRILNYGHTFGHSLEAVTDHAVPHGVAVAWGIDLVDYIAVENGMLSAKVHERIRSFIKKYLPFKLPRKVAADDLIRGAKSDKKAAGDFINLAMLEKVGQLRVVKTAFNEALREQVRKYLERESVF